MALTDERIREIAQAVRTALEGADKSRLPFHLRDFPRGACGDSEFLVAKLLEKHGHPPFDYMLGMRDGWSHGWIQQGDLIVDITADQFPDYCQPVTVVRGSAWHASFEPETEHVADFELWDADTRNMLARAFAYICTLVPPGEQPPR